MINNKHNIEFYTSYYGNLKNLLSNDIIPIVISTSHPKISDLKYICKELSPGWELINGYKLDIKDNIDPTIRYTKNYIEKLDKFDISDWIRIYNWIAGICETNNLYKVALMCYEKPGDFCHRHILAKYINKHFIKYIAPRNIKINDNKLIKYGITEFNYYKTSKELF